MTGRTCRVLRVGQQRELPRHPAARRADHRALRPGLLPAVHRRTPLPRRALGRAGRGRSAGSRESPRSGADPEVACSRRPPSSRRWAAAASRRSRWSSASSPACRSWRTARASRHGVSSRPTLRGERRPCFGLTEPDAGTNAFAMRTNRDPRRLRRWSRLAVRGQKTYISGADDASRCCWSPASTRRRQQGPAKFILPPGRHDQSWDQPSGAAHRRGRAVRPVHRVLRRRLRADDCVIGDPGSGTGYLFESLNHERVMTSAMACGLGHHVLQKGVEYAKVRAPFGKPIGGLPGHPACAGRLQGAAGGGPRDDL